MSPRPKRLPRLWCALQGLLPFDACLAAQRGELAWPAPAAANAAPREPVEPKSCRAGGAGKSFKPRP